jgi:hypothetical protein
MVEREPVGDAAATVVAGHREPVEAEPRHRRDHVGRHGALGVGRVVRRRGGAAALAVASEVRAHHRVSGCQSWRDAAPHEVGLREAVQQQEGRSAARAAHEDVGLAGRDQCGLEVVEGDGGHAGEA